jgi:hypothetical protein
MPAFGLPLVLLSFLVNLPAFGNSSFSLLRRVYAFGLMVLREFIRTIYHEV